MIKVLINTFLLFLVCGSVSAQNFKFLPDATSQTLNSSEIRATGMSAWSARISVPAVAVAEWNYIVSNPSTWSNVFRYKGVRDIVRLKVNNSHGKPVPAFRYSVMVQIDKYLTALPTVAFSEVKTLLLTYNPDSLQTYNDQATFSFTDFCKYQVHIIEVLSETVPGAGYTTVVPPIDIAENFLIETEIVSQRYDRAPTTLSTESVRTVPDDSYLAVSASHSPSMSSIPIISPQLKPAAYELEWTFIDDYQYDVSGDVVSYRFATASSLSYDFKKTALGSS